MLSKVLADEVSKVDTASWLNPEATAPSTVGAATAAPAWTPASTDFIATLAANHLSASQADHSLLKILKLYTSATLLIIDELGRLSLDQKQGEILFNVIDARYERCSTVNTPNRAFKHWARYSPI